ncbi:disease resistance protein (TIR-NBS-LRR class), partial [Trifolium pratense]
SNNNGTTTNSFVNHLYGGLVNKGINTFIKEYGEIKACIEEIENSRMSIVVLCENFASSTSCLDELVKITQYIDNKSRNVAAIFYKVEPSDIRKQKHSYEVAMAEHEKIYGKESEMIKTWRNALTRVCDLSGVHCKDDVYESVLIEKIVKDTFTKVAPAPVQMKHIVGLDTRFEDVKSVLDIESNDTVRVMGIYGAGGIGKTTFAAYLYDKIRHLFEASAFLLHVREESNKGIKGLEDLQKILLSQLGEDIGTMVGSTFKGSVEIKRRLGKRRVLLVLDDIDDKGNLNLLVGARDWFGSGSRIIITTRDETLLDSHDVEINKYKMEVLTYRDSLELFCWNAFDNNRPAENFEYMSNRAANYANRIPLALCVIGSNLKGKSIEEWESELGKYKKVPHADIQGVLEISYYSLSELERKIFLDCACFFKGEKWIYVERILKGCHYSPSLRVFASKCLMTIDENGCLMMHSLIQDMGREVVRKESPLIPGNRSRLWYHKDILQVLEGNSGSRNIEGIMFHPPTHEVVDQWTNTSFEKMKNLKILIVRNATFSTGPSSLPNSLRLLDWMGFPSKSFPPDFYPEKIVDFKLSHSPLILANPLQTFEDLTFMNLSDCLSITQMPDLSGAKNLRVFTIDRCHKLEGFHKSFGLYMSKLVYLSASECTMLKTFVPRMYFPSLEVISFNFCKRLEHFPDVMRKMDKPLKIHMINTGIKEFPESIDKLTGLEYADMSTCERLINLSRGFLLLPKLTTLKVDGCSQLRKSFRRFKESHSIANGCPNIKELCFSKANLSCEDLYMILEILPKLEYLNVSDNGFVSLPECIKGSSQLKSLDISFCRNLMDIPQLPSSIQKVDARYCHSITPKASSMLWSKVCEEKQRIQVVMPKTEIPNWFYCVGSEDIPVFWARRNFPVIALAFEFGEIKENDEIKMDTFTSEIFPGMSSDKSSHFVGLHLFVEGQEISRKDYHYCIVGEHHVLMCDLRTLFNDEEWQGLDASFGDEWKKIQVQFESQLIINHWRVYVYKQKTKDDDIQFSFPYSTDYVPIPSPNLVPKKSLNQKIKHIQSLDLVEAFGQYLNTFRSKQSATVANELLRWCRYTRGGPPSACVYEASLMQEHEDSVWNAALILEMLMRNVVNHISETKVQSAVHLVVELLTTRAQHVKEKGHEVLNINMSMPIILEECECHRFIGSSSQFGSSPTVLTLQQKKTQMGRQREAPSRHYWGSVELKEGDTLVWRIRKGKESMRGSVSNIVVLLKCQHCSLVKASSSSNVESLEEDYKDPEVEDLLKRIEKDAMRLNKSQGKLKACIIQMDVTVCNRYLMEMAIIRGQEILGRFGSNFEKTPYGKLRVDINGKSSNITMQHELEGESQDTNSNQNQMIWVKSLLRWIGRS